MRQVDIAVVGAGVIGCALALALRERGLDVALLERERVGARASSRAAGILAPQAESRGLEPLSPLGLMGRALWRDLAPAVQERSGVELGYRGCGVIQVAMDPIEAGRLREAAREQRAAGLQARWLLPGRAWVRMPLLTREAHGALWLPDEATLDPQALLPAMALAVARAGVRVYEGAEVRGLVTAGGRLTGLDTSDGPLAAEAAVLSAGAWTSLLSPAIPTIRPVRGQIAVLQVKPGLLGSVIFGPEGYLVPRADGRVIVGATMEEAGYVRGVTAGGIRDLLDEAIRLVPALEAATLVETWSGLRPGTCDKEPILGPVGPDGVYVASGHFRNGVLQAPATARLMSQLVCGERPELDLAEWAPTRFV